MNGQLVLDTVNHSYSERSLIFSSKIKKNVRTLKKLKIVETSIVIHCVDLGVFIIMSYMEFCF